MVPAGTGSRRACAFKRTGRMDPNFGIGKMRAKLLLGLVLYMFVMGCATRPREPGKAIYIPIPEGYLQPCELPAIPKDNGELSDAFTQAYLCGEQGNKDKERIRNLPRD